MGNSKRLEMLSALEVFLCESALTDGCEWAFEAFEQVRNDCLFVQELETIFVLYPEFFDAVKESKRIIVGDSVNPALFDRFGR